MTAAAPHTGTGRIGDGALAVRLRGEMRGEVLFDPASRGRYATDASIYQIEPIGVAVPRDAEDVARAIQIAAEAGVPVLPRGGGTSQCGQTVGEALVLDVSKHLDGLVQLDVPGRRAVVQPGMVLDQLNARLRPHGLWFPVDVSTSSRATIGGMAGNNSCGARSIRYGRMVDNVLAIDAILADGAQLRFGELPADPQAPGVPARYRELSAELLDLGRREADEIARRFPDLQRRVGGYNIDALVPGDGAGGAVPNLAHLLVGSEGTLAFSTAIELKLSEIPPNKVLGVCHFPDFRAAMAATRHIVKLGPAAVELVDRTMIDLARQIPMFRATVDRFVSGQPQALLLVEFAGEDGEEQLRGLRQLVELMAELGFPGGVVEAVDPAFQSAIWEVRKSGLNIMMSMKGDGKPISFIEDCAVRLEDLADYTDRLTQVFHKHGTDGTWYAHASVGCLHVRPVINLKAADGAVKMRAIAEEAFAMVREYKGSHSGEHGDGLVRSEFHEPMFGGRMVRAFGEVKRSFDPDGLFNPGKIVEPPKMDDRRLFRFKPGYRTEDLDTALDWSEWGGFAGAVEMCNNNGACRKLDETGVMCPSYRATRDEAHLTRGRANLLRLAISGQLGPGALHGEAMAEAMRLCVGCKGCKRECPVGVDMARMKVEVQYQRAKRSGVPLRERLVAALPRYAPWAARLAPLANLRDRLPGLPWLSEKLLGFSARRPLPRWRRDYFRPAAEPLGPADGAEVVLLADTFNSYFEPENLHAAVQVLVAAGRRVHLALAADGGRPLCCGRTYLAAGLVDQARAEMRRLVDALLPFVQRDLPVLGLEPSCLLTLRDELAAVLPGPAAGAVAERALLLEEYLAAESAAGRLDLPLRPIGGGKVLLHGHCHQKAHGAMAAVTATLEMIPGLAVEAVPSSCCGMAGAFGYGAETHDISLRMGEQSLLPAVRAAAPDTPVVADGVSCRQQISHGAGRQAVHVARLLQKALAPR
ncbi:MAG: FAD-linked oxidase C-terminal domain-containing protein [Alphaproteobacteria bacterium]|jgi:FAD/FMN-containing dehydrogenase/Fe-S oxidoreductase|nr:FAD-linked oxidase C-terminal domain-containing protein [Alphaproteobacteria bacterium]MDP6565669.1 FAD-linked oxidase C-terminal domain-containing protein [Alphaproteobacteria bacterium]MDP6813686.1 FAD-linked oxidase C-terminal domain-containing protein [Alphaproteobacteria bacterium]